MHENGVPILFYRKEECCGCSACYAICHKKAISMKLDDEGFLYPYIEQRLCEKCQKCLLVCPLKK